MPGLNCSKLTYFDEIQDIDNLFGFFKVRVEAPLGNYLGLLPVRKGGGLTFPLGIWEGWYFSEELKFAKENGYKITVLSGYSFSREYKVLDSYINKVYAIKSNPINPTQKSMAKSLLNNLLGRFGINLEKAITEVLTSKEFNSKMLMHKITSYKWISDNKVLVTYVPKLDYDIIESHGLDLLKVLNKFEDKELQGQNVTSVVISAAVNAYARIHITKIKLDIFKQGVLCTILIRIV